MVLRYPRRALSQLLLRFQNWRKLWAFPQLMPAILTCHQLKVQPKQVLDVVVVRRYLKTWPKMNLLNVA